MRIKNRKTAYVLSFLIPMVMYLLIGIFLRLYPLSDNTILKYDMGQQFVNFYAAFKHMFTDNNNFIYSFSKNLGGDMVGFTAYYLQNPYLFILFLFPDDKLPAGIFLMIVLMLSTSGLTFQIFVSKVFGRHNIIFSTVYAMMGYVTAYFTESIYFCNIILLPIVIMGLYMIMNDSEEETKKGALIYTMSLAASILTNYYLGYMLCLFLVLYFVYLCFYFSGNKSEGDAGNAGVFFYNLIAFVLYSCLGVMISCFDLVPVALSLRNQKDTPGAGIFEIHRLFRLTDLYKAFLPGAFNGDVSNYSLPYIYIGIIPLICVLLYFFNRKVQLGKRIAALALIGVMVMSLYLDPFNTVWHAFNAPVGFAHRFAFYLCFILIVIGYLGFEELVGRIEDMTDSHKEKADQLEKVPGSLETTTDSLEEMAGCLKPNGLNRYLKKILIPVIFTVTLLDLFYNGYHAVRNHVSECKTQSTYESNYDRIDAVTEGYKSLEDDNSLYRAEKDFLDTMLDPLRHGYAGLSHNSSCEKDYVKNFMGKVGLRNQGIWAFYNQGSTAFTDCFLGVKYFTSRFDSTEKPYESIMTNDAKENNQGERIYDESYTYLNHYALPLGFFIDESRAQTVNMKSDNLFEIQNEIAGCFDFDGKIQSEANITGIKVCGNVILSDEFLEHAERNGIRPEIIGSNDLNSASSDSDSASNDSDLASDDSDSASSDSDSASDDLDSASNDSDLASNDLNSANSDLDSKNDNKTYAEFIVMAESADEIAYFYFAAPKMQGARIYVNDVDWDDYFSDWRWAVEKIGTFNEGDVYKIRVEATGDALTLDDYYIYNENITELSKWYDSAVSLGADSVILKKISSSHIEGEFNAVKDSLMTFSVPYEKGWHIKIDGKRVRQQMVFEALMAVEVEAGNHSIEMVYVPEGILPGAIISVIGILLLIVLMKRETSEKQ